MLFSFLLLLWIHLAEATILWTEYCPKYLKNNLDLHCHQALLICPLVYSTNIISNFTNELEIPEKSRINIRIRRICKKMNYDTKTFNNDDIEFHSWILPDTFGSHSNTIERWIGQNSDILFPELSIGVKSYCYYFIDHRGIGKTDKIKNTFLTFQEILYNPDEYFRNNKDDSNIDLQSSSCFSLKNIAMDYELLTRAIIKDLKVKQEVKKIPSCLSLIGQNWSSLLINLLLSKQGTDEAIFDKALVINPITKNGLLSLDSITNFRINKCIMSLSYAFLMFNPFERPFNSLLTIDQLLLQVIIDSDGEFNHHIKSSFSFAQSCQNSLDYNRILYKIMNRISTILTKKYDNLVYGDWVDSDGIKHAIRPQPIFQHLIISSELNGLQEFELFIKQVPLEADILYSSNIKDAKGFPKCLIPEGNQWIVNTKANNPWFMIDKGKQHQYIIELNDLNSNDCKNILKSLITDFMTFSLHSTYKKYDFNSNGFLPPINEYYESYMSSGKTFPLKSFIKIISISMILPLCHLILNCVK